MSKLNINDAKLRVKQNLQQSTLYGAGKKKMLYSKENIDSLEYLTSYGKTIQDDLYVFKLNNQVIISPANDELEPVLAIVNAPDFNLDELPEHIKDWFLMYAEQIEDFENNTANENKQYSSNIYGATDSSFYSDWETIDEIVKFKWAQDIGYFVCTKYLQYSYTIYADSSVVYPYNNQLILIFSQLLYLLLSRNS